MNSNAPAEIIPLISGSAVGPLNLVHLPRLWLKMRAHAAGRLPTGYRHGTGGTDEALLDAIGLDADAFAAYIAADAPDYQACEAWVRAHARDTSAHTIDAFNAQVRAFEMPDPRRTEWTARFGLTAGTYTRAIALNQLDDWAAVHEQIRAPGAPVTALVPAISSSVSGPLGVQHLPRLWLKHRLHGAGRLPAGYHNGAGFFDRTTLEMIGVDREAFASYVVHERPDYLTAEGWVRANATSLTADAIAALNARLNATKMPPAMLVDRHAELGITDPSFDMGIMLNDLDDWAELHRSLS